MFYPINSMFYTLQVIYKKKVVPFIKLAFEKE